MTFVCALSQSRNHSIITNASIDAHTSETPPRVSTPLRPRTPPLPSLCCSAVATPLLLSCRDAFAAQLSRRLCYSAVAMPSFSTVDLIQSQPEIFTQECGLIERALAELYMKEFKIVDQLSYKEQEVSLLEKLGSIDRGEFTRNYFLGILTITGIMKAYKGAWGYIQQMGSIFGIKQLPNA